MPYTLVPASVLTTIKDNKVPFVNRTDNGHIIGHLLQTFLYHLVKVSSFDLQLQFNALHGTTLPINQRHANEQIGALAPQPILTVDIASPINDTLQESLKKQLGTCLSVVELPDPCLTRCMKHEIAFLADQQQDIV